MTTKERLSGYLKAYRSHLKAVRFNDPFVGDMDPPKPEAYGLTGVDKWAAEKHAELLAKNFAKE